MKQYYCISGQKGKEMPQQPVEEKELQKALAEAQEKSRDLHIVNKLLVDWIKECQKRYSFIDKWPALSSQYVEAQRDHPKCMLCLQWKPETLTAQFQELHKICPCFQSHMDNCEKFREFVRVRLLSTSEQPPFSTSTLPVSGTVQLKQQKKKEVKIKAENVPLKSKTE